ncbi:MAG: bifunctional folylpolyglutamate synthase/dihydrofolate synthase [Ignavibacteria bacterium]
MKFKQSEYRKLLQKLYSLERTGIKYNLSNIKYLLKVLDHPHRKFKSVHIAGTNGKGAVCSMVNSILIESGYKTGLFTSPHIIDFRERILVEGKKIGMQYIYDTIESLWYYIKKIRPSFFEVTTAIAFKYFADKEVDIAVIETGLGGRLDATNVLKPICSAITGISIDHTEYLGSTLESIAKEKAGIIKRGVPCVIGKLKHTPLKVIKNRCKLMQSSLINSQKEWQFMVYSNTMNGIKFNVLNREFKGENFFVPVNGDYQLINIKTALSIANLLKKKGFEKITIDSVKNGLEKIKENSFYRARFEVITEEPRIILDVSHNLEGIKNIERNIDLFKKGKLIIIFGMMVEKDIVKSVRILEKLCSKLILTKSSYKRAMEPGKILDFVKNKSKAIITKEVEMAYNIAKTFLQKNDTLLVCGSFFVISDFLKIGEFKKKRLL